MNPRLRQAIKDVGEALERMRASKVGTVKRVVHEGARSYSVRETLEERAKRDAYHAHCDELYRKTMAKVPGRPEHRIAELERDNAKLTADLRDARERAKKTEEDLATIRRLHEAITASRVKLDESAVEIEHLRATSIGAPLRAAMAATIAREAAMAALADAEAYGMAMRIHAGDRIWNDVEKRWENKP